MGGAGGLKVLGICYRRLVYREVIEARSDYEKFYSWGFKNIVCGDLTGSNRIEKHQVHVPDGLV